MNIQEKIKEDLQQAMREKDAVTLQVLRATVTAITNECISSRKKSDEILPDGEIIQIIRKLVKQRKESIHVYKEAGRTEAATVEEREIEVLSRYLPEEISDEELRKIVEKKKEEIGAEDMKMMGALIKEVMKVVGDTADGSRVSQMVRLVLQ